MNIPMDVEHDFKWEVTQPRKQKTCEYLSPIKRNRIDLDCTEIIKYLPTINSNDVNNKKIQKERQTSIFKKLTNINFGLCYKYIFYLTDIFLSLLLMYLLIQLFFFLQKDIMHKINVKKFELQKLTETARKNFKINKCNKSTRVPALEKICSEWECIINTGSIKYTSVLFEVLGDVCNGFIDRISWKSLGVLSFF
ncbi:hypothetical protein NCER_101114 [Vairimorpha ceranae BRL01]|nr:hypothetical protein NCER_101114 [Vairimorpha ceranae BRL01]